MSKFYNQVIDTAVNNIKDTDLYLESICNEYGLNYEDLDAEPSNKIEFVNEGILANVFRAIKNFFRKVIQFLVKIWKKLVEFVKGVINWVVSKVKKLFGKDEKKAEKVELYAKFCMEATSVEGLNKYDGLDDLKKAFKASIDKISKEINIQSKKNIDFMKKYEKFVINQTKVTESTILLERVIYNDQPTDLSDKELTDISRKFINTKYNSDESVFFGGDMVSTMNMENIDTMNIHGLQALKQAGSNIFELYECFKNDTLDKVLETWNKIYDKSNDPVLGSKAGSNLAMKKLIHAVYEMNSAGFDTKLIYQLNSEIYPKFDKEEDLRRWVNLKINFNQGLIACLKDMILINYKMFDISSFEAFKIANDIGSNKLDGLRNLFKDNFEKFVDRNNRWIDLRSIGLGILCFSESVMFGDSDHINFFDMYKRTDMSDRLLTISYKYDIAIESHGGYEDVTLGELYQASAKYREQKQLCEEVYADQFKFYEEELGISKDKLLTIDLWDELTMLNDYRNMLGVKSLDLYHLTKFIKKDNTTSSIKNKKHFGLINSKMTSEFNTIYRTRRWTCQEVILPNGEKFIDMELLLYSLMRQGFKNVLIMNCNPGRIVLNKELRNSSKILITMSTISTMG